MDDISDSGNSALPLGKRKPWGQAGPGYRFGRGFWLLALECAALAAAADALVIGRPRGVATALFALVLLAAVLARPIRRGSARAVGVLAALLAGMAAALVVDPGLIATGAVVLGLVVVALTRSGGWSSIPEVWLRRLVTVAAGGWQRLARDVSAHSRWLDTRALGVLPGTEPALVGLRGWALPVGLSALFLALFGFANPVLALGLSRLADEIAGVIADVSIPEPIRVFGWLLSFVLAWMLLRTRTAPLGRYHGEPEVAGAVLDTLDPRTLVRCLVLFNLAFALENLLDLRYLWAGAALPEGMTFATYAHRGAYPLVATALLAALFVIIAFRPGGGAECLPRARRLVLVWVAQNVVLTASSVLRLRRYVDAYSLTRLRIAAGVWMMLVAAGLVLICLRIASRRSNRWLLQSNLVVLGCVLYGLAFANLDGTIAWHNVRHAAELGRSGPALDFEYLASLGGAALPATEWAAAHLSAGATRDRALMVASVARAALEVNLRDWRGWTVRRWWWQRGGRVS